MGKYAEKIIENIDKVQIATVLATLSTWLFGNITAGLRVLVTCMTLDYILGVVWGYKDKNLNSKVAFAGLKKKMTIMIILIVSVQLDRMLGQGWTFRTLVIYFYTSMECLSILETAGKFGVPIPARLKKALTQLQDKDVVKEVKEEENEI